MKSRLIHEGGERTWAVVFDAGDEALDGLTRFAEDEGLDAARFTAIGGFERATLGYFVIDEQDYAEIPVDEQVEVLSLQGDVAAHDDEVKVHAHVVVGTSTGDARGGHLLAGVVRPTLEVMVTESPDHLRRRFVPRFGIALIDPDAG